MSLPAELNQTNLRWDQEEGALIGGRVLELALLASHLLSNDEHAIEPSRIKAEVIRIADALLAALSPDLLFVFEATTDSNESQSSLNRNKSVKDIQPILIKSRLPGHLPEHKLHRILQRQIEDLNNGKKRTLKRRSFMEKVATPDVWEEGNSIGIIVQFGELKFSFVFHTVGSHLFACGTEITALDEEGQLKQAVADKVLASAEKTGKKMERQGLALWATQDFVSTMEILLETAVRSGMPLPESVAKAREQVAEFKDRLRELLQIAEE